MDEVGVQARHVALESPESLNRVERRGGLLKSMFRRVCAENRTSTPEHVEIALILVCQVKNDSLRVGGFSPSQWVLGKAPRGVPSLTSEEQRAELGAIQSRFDPGSVFALQRLARLEAQKAFVRLDAPRRVQKALAHTISSFRKGIFCGRPRRVP